MEWQSKIYFSFPHNVNFIRFGSSSLQYLNMKMELCFSVLYRMYFNS